MKRSLLIGLAVLVVGLLAGILVFRRSAESFLYQGKPVRAWAEQLYSPGQKSRDEATAALKAMGTNAVPELIRMLQAKDSFFRKLAWSIPRVVPGRVRLFLLRNVRMPNAAFIQDAAARALATIGPDAKVAVPVLAQALRSNEREVREDAAIALGCIGEDAIPELIDALASKDAKLRALAAYALASAGPGAKSAIPALMRTLKDENEAVRTAGAHALSAVGISAVPALLHAIEHEKGLAR